MSPDRKKAFTLVEVLLVVILTGIILTSLSVHIFGLSEAYFRSQKNRAIEEHAEGCLLLLQGIAVRTRPLPTGALNEEGTDPAGMDAHLTHFTFAQRPGSLSSDEPCLSFQLPESPLLLSGKNMLTDTRNYLYLTREGLCLSYTSSLLPQEDTAEPNYRTVLISPYVSRLEYGYYNSEYATWVYSESPRSDMGRIITPAVLRLSFSYGKMTLHKTVSLERSSAHAPLH